MDELVKAILDRIDSELRRCYWNENQKEMLSPFANTGNNYSNKFFSVRAYDWNDDDEDEPKPNFESDFLICWWYKHAHRGLQYEINWSGDTSVSELSCFLDDCLNSIRDDFGERY